MTSKHGKLDQEERVLSNPVNLREIMHDDDDDIKEEIAEGWYPLKSD